MTLASGCHYSKNNEQILMSFLMLAGPVKGRRDYILYYILYGKKISSFDNTPPPPLKWGITFFKFVLVYLIM